MFLENHDQPRSISHFLPEGADRVSGGKALGTLLLTMRGTPFLMEGEELGYVNVSWPSIDDYTESASFDTSVVENAELLISTNDKSQKGTLAPLEAVIYEEVIVSL